MFYRMYQSRTIHLAELQNCSTVSGAHPDFNNGFPSTELTLWMPASASEKCRLNVAGTESSGATVETAQDQDAEEFWRTHKTYLGDHLFFILFWRKESRCRKIRRRW
jgi:hypothetical protein